MKLTRDGGIRCNENAEKDYPCAKAPDAEAKGEGEYHHSHKLERVTQLVILLGEVCYRDERHIENYVLGKPADADGKVAENQSADYGERA